jgi:hypothetical protein
MTDNDNRMARFEARFRQWANRAPGTLPTDAARRVTARIAAHGRPNRVSVWAQRLAVACGIVLVTASGVLLWKSQAPPPMPASSAEAPPVLPDNVVIFWLDAETPVYFVVRPLEDASGGTP